MTTATSFCTLSRGSQACTADQPICAAHEKANLQSFIDTKDASKFNARVLSEGLLLKGNEDEEFSALGATALLADKVREELGLSLGTSKLATAAAVAVPVGAATGAVWMWGVPSFVTTATSATAAKAATMWAAMPAFNGTAIAQAVTTGASSLVPASVSGLTLGTGLALGTGVVGLGAAVYLTYNHFAQPAQPVKEKAQ